MDLFIRAGYVFYGYSFYALVRFGVLRSFISFELRILILILVLFKRNLLSVPHGRLWDCLYTLVRVFLIWIRFWLVHWNTGLWALVFLWLNSIFSDMLTGVTWSSNGKNWIFLVWFIRESFRLRQFLCFGLIFLRLLVTSIRTFLNLACRRGWIFGVYTRIRIILRRVCLQASNGSKSLRPPAQFLLDLLRIYWRLVLPSLFSNRLFINILLQMVRLPLLLRFLLSSRPQILINSPSLFRAV